jgi:methylthioribose-1-phosphate isomerase
MNVNGRHYRTIWLKETDNRVVQIINQLTLPHSFEILDLRTVEDIRKAIKDMYVRGAGLIGATAAYGMYLAALEAGQGTFEADLLRSAAILKGTRPTASNLAWAVKKVTDTVLMPGLGLAQKREAARLAAQAIAGDDADYCRRIGLHGADIIKAIAAKKNGGPVNILTHCNAGWLAFVDYGTALSPVYAAFDSGIKVHVWVDETRPRNQGASLTAWELGQHGVPHDLIPDNAGGHLMQHGMVDLVVTGADRVTRCGDAANKIGTYLKAVAAKENGVPFYVALPSSTFDFTMRDGLREIPIEERDAAEVRFISGKTKDGAIETVLLCPDSTPARNWGFDVTPARYITGLISERGICAASEQGILGLYPEQSPGICRMPGEEGSVKYTAEHTQAPAMAHPLWSSLNHVRTQLYDLGLIGAYPNGVGFGNLSIRIEGNQFLISGTATGAKRELGPDDYCLVRSCDINGNRVLSFGPIQASSESMSHGAIYHTCGEAAAVIHIHSNAIFEGMLRDNLLSTPKTAAYGTPEMARAISNAVEQWGKTPGKTQGSIVLAGHDEGVITWGVSIEEALAQVLELYHKYSINNNP